MIPESLHSRPEIEAYLRQDPYLHLYGIGDLDEFFWPYTTWLASRIEGRLAAVILLYSGGGLPVALALARPGLPGPGGMEAMVELLESSLPFLPRRFYSHLTPGLAEILAARGYCLESHGRYYKMALAHPERLAAVNTGEVVAIGPGDLDDLLALYTDAYPGNWFDPRMLETGCYYGLRRDGRLASAAGIHVFSPRYRAAALGNITTLPELRGQGLGKLVTARVCQALLKQVDTIGLNVRADNTPAQSAYRKLGFEVVAEYDEYMVG